MAKRLTRKKQYVRLPEKRIREIENLVASWTYETKAFMRARLNQYHPHSDMLNTMLEFLLSLFMSAPEKKFAILRDPEIMTDWEKGGLEQNIGKRGNRQGLYLSVVAAE